MRLTKWTTAATFIEGKAYCYNRNGSMIPGNGRTIAWTAFNKPSRMARGTAAVEITYGPDRSRILRKDYAGATLTSTTRYVGGYEKVTLASGVVEQRHHIAGVAVITKVGTGISFKENYLLTDHLGSVIATVDVNRLPENGYLGDRTSFDAFGLRRTSDWKAMSLGSLYSFKSLISERGYTGHEQMDSVGLIHMNGRVYDPVIGRFISADPIIQAPGDLQSYNRYSYVFNNPLTLTDPSGFSAWTKFRDNVRDAAGVILTGGFSLHVKLADKGLREFGRFARKNKFVAEAVQIGGALSRRRLAPLDARR